MLVLLALLGCGGGGGGSSPTSPITPPPSATYLVATNSIFSPTFINGNSTHDFDSRMDFDGRTVAPCQPTNQPSKLCGYLVRIPNVEPGNHQLSIVVTRQAGSPNDFRYDGALILINELTQQQVWSREFHHQARLRTGQAITMTVTVP